MAWTTPKTDFQSGNVLNASEMNDIGGNLLELAPFFGAWTTFTAQLRTGTTNRNSTINYARYLQIGKLVIAQANVTASVSGGASEVIKLGLPSGLTPVNTGDMGAVGQFLIKDSGTAYYVGVAVEIEVGYISGIAYNAVNNMGAAAPTFTMASGDAISYSVMFEVA